MLLPKQLLLLLAVWLINFLSLVPLTQSQGGGGEGEGGTGTGTGTGTETGTVDLTTQRPTSAPVGFPECRYPNVTQQCCSGGYYIFNSKNGPPVCYDGYDLCSEESLIGNASVLDYDLTYDSTDESCWCNYYLEACEPDYRDFEDDCHDARTWECCALVESGAIDVECDGLTDATNPDASECTQTLTYDCSRVDKVCNEEDTDIVWESYWSEGADVTSEPYIFYWWDQVNQTLKGSCYCVYNFFISSCPTVAPTDEPTSVPTDEPTSYNASQPSFYAVLKAIFIINIDDITESNCDDTSYWRKVFNQIFENTYSLDTSCDLYSGSRNFNVTVTAKWLEKEDYSSDLSAVERVESDPLDEIEEYGPIGLNSVTVVIKEFTCSRCYELSQSLLTKPNIIVLITLMGCIIFHRLFIHWR